MRSLLHTKRNSSFLLVFLYILCTLAIQGCIPVATGIPALDAANIAAGAVVYTVGGISKALDDDPDIDPDDFDQLGYDPLLRDGEKVEYYGKCNSRASIAITDDRVLLLPPTYGIQNEIYWSIEHIEINRIDLPKQKSIWGGTFIREIHLFPYDSVDVEILYCDYSGKEITQITQAIQTQVDDINTIRSELGITIPETVTTSELIKLNEPVIAELRARRNTLTEVSQQEPKIAFIPNQCPDISGIYYDRFIDAYVDPFGQSKSNEDIPHSGDYNILYTDKDDDTPQSNRLCSPSGKYYKNAMVSECSLRHWFDTSVMQNRYTDSCLPRKIEFVTTENYKTLDVITYVNNKVDKKFTIGIESAEVRCEGGNIILIDERYGKGYGYKATLFLSEDGSLIIQSLYVNDYLNIKTKSIFHYIWGRVDSVSNPYESCPEVQP